MPAGSGRFSHILSASLFAILLLLSASAGPALALGRAPGGYAVGVRSLSVLSPEKVQLGVMVWYPSTRSGQGDSKCNFGPWVLRAEKDAPLAEVRAPVVIISHDSSGHSLSHHETAAALAARGFVVIAPTHAGDSMENASAMYSAALLYFRPLQALEALEAVAASPVFAGSLDLQRVGLLGVGAGALTALQLGGVDIDASAYSGYCLSFPADAALCSRRAEERLGLLPAELREIRRRRGRNAPAAPFPYSVRALGLLTPGWLVFAKKEALSALKTPLAALFAGADGLYPPARDLEEARRLFSLPLEDETRFLALENADHYSLSAQCPAGAAGELPEICGEKRGEEREELMLQRDAFFSSFFLSTLGKPLPR